MNCSEEKKERIIEIAKTWENEEKSRVFALLTTGKREAWGIEFFYPLVTTIREEYLDMPVVDTIDIILDSSGGLIDVSYQLANFIRSKCKKLRIFIPEWAKSAATLFVLCADEIHMTDFAELGPLDAQIVDPRHPEDYERISALDYFGAMDYLKQYSFEMMDTYILVLLNRNKSMRLKDMIDLSSPFVTKLMRSLYNQVDPLEFGRTYRTLDLASQYGKRLMKRFGYIDLDDAKINRIVNKLTWEYPSHSFVIDKTEAKEIGLNIIDMSKKRQADALEIIRSTNCCIGFITDMSSAKGKKK